MKRVLEETKETFKTLWDGVKKNPTMALMTGLNLAVFTGICLKIKDKVMFKGGEYKLWLVKK